MIIGFYEELGEIQKDDSFADFGFLENVQVTPDLNAFDFLHGYCADFAAVLSDVYGYSIECIRHIDEDGEDGRLIHAYCIDELNGETAYIDIRGITTIPEVFFRDFENEVTYDPQSNELWDLEGLVSVECWPTKNDLFDGDYEGYINEDIEGFIFSYDEYFNVSKFQKKLSLDHQIRKASLAFPDNTGTLKTLKNKEISL